MAELQKLLACQSWPRLAFDVLPKSISISEAVTQLLEAKKSANRRQNYLTSLSQYLARFAKGREARPIAEFSTEDVEAWLHSFSDAYTRQTQLNRVSTLFAFAVRRGFINQNPCIRIEKITVDKKPPMILTPEQAELLLKMTPNVCQPYLILGMFAGVRPEELLRADWKDINLETKTACIDGKTRRRRITPLEPRAVALLAACPLQKGPIAPSNSTVRRWKRTACKALGVKTWPKDFLRHTAASYLMALIGDAGKVAARLGNSASILLSHYHEPVTTENSNRFWSGTFTPTENK